MVMPNALEPYYRQLSSSVSQIEQRPQWPTKFRQESYIHGTNCSKYDDFLRYLVRRHKEWGIGDHDKRGKYISPTRYLIKHHIWQYLLNDKLASYLFGKMMNIKVPQIYACGSDVTHVVNQLDNEDLGIKQGFVIKNSSSMNSKGVYVYEHGFHGIESIRGIEVSKEIITNQLNQSSIFVEEYVRPQIPGQRIIDFQIYTFNGHIASVGIVRRYASAARTSGHAEEKNEVQSSPNVEENCNVYVDEDFNFLDTVCVKDKPRRCGSQSHSSLLCSFCGEFQRPSQWNAMMYSAKRMSKRIGVAIRLDFYIDGKTNEPVLGEITPAPSAGHYHCMAKVDRMTGHIDSCWIGQVWKYMSEGTDALEGGPITPIPDILEGWDTMTYEEKCKEVLTIDQTISYIVN